MSKLCQECRNIEGTFFINLQDSDIQDDPYDKYKDLMTLINAQPYY
jgi:hypothetical protein